MILPTYILQNKIKKTRMTAFISSEAQKNMDGQTEKVRHRADDVLGS